MGKGAKKEITFFIILLFLSLLLLLADSRGWLSSTRAFLERPVLAVEEKLYSLRLSFSQLNLLISRESREKEIMSLQGQLRQLAVEDGQLATCLEENEAMKRLLGAPLPAQWKFLPAKVIGLAEKMRLDKGRSDGVVEGMMVVSENILIGKVIAGEEKSALVQLLTDPVAKIPVVVKKVGDVGVQARGLLISQGGKLVLDRVLQSEDIREGDLVLTAGEGGWRPDLLIGQLGEVFGREAAVYQQAQILPLLDYQQLRIVFVVIQ